MTTIGSERSTRRYDHTNGLIVSTIFSLTQDTQGYIWIGTAGGLVRYDGDQMRPWAKKEINRDVYTLRAGPNGEVLVAENSGELYRIKDGGVELLPGPQGNSFPNIRDAEFDSGGRLFVVTTDGQVFQRDLSQRWDVLNVAQLFPGETVRRIRSAGDGRVFVLTNKAVWLREGAGRLKRLLEVMRPVDALQHPNGSIFVAAWQIDAELIEIRRDGNHVKRANIFSRPADLALRGDVVWMSTAISLISVRKDEPAEFDEVASGGPLLVDHEDSLWLGSFNGLIQYPEPETKIFTDKDGLATSHTRSLVKTDEGIWVGTWADLGRISKEGYVWKVYDEKLPAVPHEDRGRLLVATGEGLFSRQNGRYLKRSSVPVLAHLADCLRTGGDTLLFATPNGIFRDNPQGEPEALSSPTDSDGRPAYVLRLIEDEAQRLWAATGDGKVCHAPIATVLSSQPASWSCQTIDEHPDTFDFVRVSSGGFWMSTNRAGVWRLQADRWVPIPGSQNLPSSTVFNMTASPAAGTWLAGHAITTRVIERTDLSDGWKVQESVSMWHGLPGTETNDIIEESEGHLWITTPSGVVRVPAHARGVKAQPPRVLLVDVVVNGHQTVAEQLNQLPHRSQVELHFAAMTFRDRTRLRFQYRLDSSKPWIDIDEKALVLRFVDLPAGRYETEVRASIDDLNWTQQPLKLAFEILGPWYLRPWALALFALLTGAALYAVHRARVSTLVKLEGQREQIAMDLHDEMGSGLGSIGLLSALAAKDNLEETRRQDFAKKIAVTADELGNTLTEIVWALKPHDPSLQSLAYHIAERAGRLFSGEPAFRTNFPAKWPNDELSLAVRRNLLLIALEALHNAVRHSRAKHVTFGIEPASGRSWRLWVGDDGEGLPTNGRPAATSGGNGMLNMRKRANEIGAQISWTAYGGRGTLVSIVFNPRAHQALKKKLT